MTCCTSRSGFMDNAFGCYGRKVGTYPWVFIISCVVVNGLLGLGLLRIKAVNNVEEIYVPSENQAAKDRATVKDLFPDKSGTAFFPQHVVDDGRYGDIIIATNDRSSVLKDAVLDEVFTLLQRVQNFSFLDSNKSMVEYHNVCARFMTECFVDGFFLLSKEFRRDLLSKNVTYPFYDTKDLSFYFGAVVHRDGILQEAKYLRLRFYLRQDQHYNSLSGLWETQFLKEMSNIDSHVNLTMVNLAYASSDSLNAELDKNTGGDIIWFSLTFTLMITYASIVSSSRDCVSSRGFLATAGVLAAGLGIVGGMGLVSLFLPFTNIVGVMPFLVLGVGIDDTFIMMSGWSDNFGQVLIPERLAATLRTSGVSITLTSLTDIVSFLIGLTSSFYGVRIFCTYTGVAILFCYLNQMTFFAGCLAIHGQRVKSSRHWLTCAKTRSKEEILQQIAVPSNGLRSVTTAITSVCKSFVTRTNPDESTEVNVSGVTLICHANEEENVYHICQMLRDNTYFNNGGQNYVRNNLFVVSEIKTGNVFHFRFSRQIAESIGVSGALTMQNIVPSGDFTIIFTPKLADEIKNFENFSIYMQTIEHKLQRVTNYHKVSKTISVIAAVQCKVSQYKEQVVKDTGSVNLGFRSKVNLFCCSGEPPSSQKDEENCFESGPRKVLPKLILSLPGRLLIVLMFFCYLGWSIYGSTNIQQGLDLKNLVAESSYFYKYSEWNTEHYQTRFLLSFTITQRVSYSDEQTSDRIDSLVKRVLDDDIINKNSLVSWIKAYQNSHFFNNRTEESFVTSLKMFLRVSPVYENDVVFKNGSIGIFASRFYVQTIDVDSSSEQGKLMTRMRDLTTSSDLPVIVYCPPFVYFEQYNAIVSNTLQTVGVAVAAMFVLTVVFICHPFMVASITVAMVTILVGIFGFMYFWNLTLSSVTMIHLVMSIGFSVDYCAHICHAVKESRNYRNSRKSIVERALEVTGGPILNGAMSSFIGIIMLLPSESYIFKSFFKVMLLVILFGILHSVMFLPVFFAICGPKGSVTVEEIRPATPSTVAVSCIETPPLILMIPRP